MLVEPRVRSTPSRAGRSHRLGRDAVELCRRAGLELDDWQEMILVDSLRRDRAGLWRSFEVGVDVSRQNGKGGVLEARKLTGLFLLKEPLQVYSSHMFDTSLEAFRRLKGLIEDTPELAEQVKRYAQSHGEEGIELWNGSRIRYRTRTKGGGRGFSCDCLYLDEAMIISEAMHGALLPTLSARKNPQVWYTGSAVDQAVHENGVVFARVRERGHRGDPALSYYEWSVDADHPDKVTAEMAADPELWRQANPAMGVRIREKLVETEQRSMDPRTFAVERLGVGDWPRTDHVVRTVIDIEAWARLADPASRLVDPVCLAFDVSPERRSSIAAGGRSVDGFWHVEIIESGPGTNWMTGRLVELVAHHKPTAVVCDGYGPAAALIAPLEAAGIMVDAIDSTGHARACARLVDFIGDEELRHLGSAELAAAIQVARTRPLGDGWAWSRKNSMGNISPLVSATLALAAAVEHPAEGGFEVYNFDADGNRVAVAA